MDSAPILSPSSDQCFWSSLRDRVDAILEDRKLPCGVELKRGKQFRHDSLLLIRGLDSVASSLSHLTEVLGATEQGLNDLAKPSMTKVLKRESQVVDDEECQRKTRRRCSSNEPLDKNCKQGVISPEEIQDKSQDGDCDGKGDRKKNLDVTKSGNMKKAKDLAISMASKAASLATELKVVKSKLCLIQERCSVLEEENRRLRDGFEKGVGEAEDDLVRLQLEALLAEKARLASENANLTRENQCLHQLVEYHQLTSQELSASYEQAIHGICLDFSSPTGKSSDGIDENELYDGEIPSALSSKHLDFSLHYEEQTEGELQ